MEFGDSDTNQEQHQGLNPDEEKTSTNLSIKKPKKVLHFSDGTLEEFSEDEADEAKETEAQVVDPSQMTWGPWAYHVLSRSGKSVLGACDYVGEGVANFLGITSQKYFYEIEEYKRALKEDETIKMEVDAEMSGWGFNGSNSADKTETKIPKHFENKTKEGMELEDKY